MSRRRSDQSHRVSRFPRVSGDEPERESPRIKGQKFSPRERG